MSTETVRPSILNEGQVIKNVDQAFGMDPIENDPYQAEAEADWAAYVKFRREQLGGFTTENPDGRVVLRNNDGTYKSIKSIPVESDKEYRNRLYDESATTDTTDMPDSFRTWPGYNGDQSSSEAPQDTAEENVQEEAMPKQEESASKKKTEVWRAGEKDIYEEGQPVHRVINPRLNEEPTGARYWMQGRTETRNPAHEPYQRVKKDINKTKTPENLSRKQRLAIKVGVVAMAAAVALGLGADKNQNNNTSTSPRTEQSGSSSSNRGEAAVSYVIDHMSHKTENTTVAPEKDVAATEYEVISTGEVNEEDTVGPEEMAEEIGITPLNEIDNASETIEESGGDLLTGQDSTESEESDTHEQETDKKTSDLVEKLMAGVEIESGEGVTHAIEKVLAQAGYYDASPVQLYEIYEALIDDPNIGPNGIFTDVTLVNGPTGDLWVSEPGVAHFTLAAAEKIASRRT